MSARRSCRNSGREGGKEISPDGHSWLRDIGTQQSSCLGYMAMHGWAIRGSWVYLPHLDAAVHLTFLLLDALTRYYARWSQKAIMG